MKSHRYLWLGTAVLGTATGFFIPKKERPAPEIAGTSKGITAKETKHAGTGKESAGAILADLPVSKDNIGDLLALDAAELYGRAGLWLLDASAEDIATFWKTYHDRGNANSWVKDLVFTQWAKKDLDGLMAAAKRDKEEGPAWWAWTMSDPDAALAAMEGQPEEIRSYVLRGIGNFHPKRALEMLEKDPSLANQFKLSTLAEELAKNDPEAAVDFLAKRGSYELGKALRKWAEDDPHRAFEWLSERSRDADLRSQFVDTVMQENPGVLSELTAGMPSGAAKRVFEDAIFNRLAETNPEKALEDARKIEAPLLAAQRLTQVGKAMVSENPEQALEILREALETCPDATTRMKWTRYPGGASGSGGGVPGVTEFIGELARWNPQLVMESVSGIGEGTKNANGDSRSEQTAAWHVANAWIAKDADGFSGWVGQQDEATFNFGAATYASYLTNRENFTEAVAWAQQIKDPARQANALMESIANWVSRDREAATQWFEQAELPEESRTRLGAYFKRDSQ